MHTRVANLDKRLSGHIQVPDALWADSWHFRPDGLQVFATTFAKVVVEHLRAAGRVVEGLEQL
jgi:hypothetical protein